MAKRTPATDLASVLKAIGGAGAGGSSIIHLPRPDTEGRKKKRKRTQEPAARSEPEPERVPTPTPASSSIPSTPGRSLSPIPASPIASGPLQSETEVEMIQAREAEPVLVVPDEESPPVASSSPAIAPGSAVAIEAPSPAPTFGTTSVPELKPAISDVNEAFSPLFVPGFQASPFAIEFLVTENAR